MSLVNIDELDGSAKVWIFPSTAALSDEAIRIVTHRMQRFLDGWTAHGSPVKASAHVADGRFLVIAADSTDVSGCSIDGLFTAVRDLQHDVATTFLDSTQILYRDANGEVRSATRPQFRALAGSGEVNLQTPVFDSSVDSLSDFRDGRMERPARDSWHAAYFQQAV